MVTPTDVTVGVRRNVPVAAAPRFEQRFRVMGTEAHVLTVHGDPELLDEARARLGVLHRRWTRFDPMSEVSRINAGAGAPVAVSAETVLLVGLAVTAWERTDGLFDPSILPALEAAGYDRDFSEITAGDGDRADPTTYTGSSSPGCTGVVVDTGAGTVTVPAGRALDFSGIAKGLAADMVVADLLDGGAIGACVNIGGDLRAEGVAPTHGGWVVAVDQPTASTVLGNICLTGGAVATTSRMKRVWGSARTQHHLIDPRTGQPARTGLRGVTVVTGDGWVAESLTKAAFLAGPEDGPRVLDDAGAHGLFLLDDSSVRMTARWREVAA